MTEERMPMPAGGPAMRDPGRVDDRPLDDPRAIQILSTEHWSLLATRSLSWNESFSRTSLFLSVLSASVVALGLVGGATGFGGEFSVFALALLPVTLFVGVATFVRLDEVNMEDAMWVVAMNRIRHAYLEANPGLRPYFSSGWTDDEQGVALTFGMTRAATPVNTLIHQFVTTPGMVAVIDGALAAAISGIALSAVIGPGMLASIPVGLVVGTATTAVLLWSSIRRGRRVIGRWKPRFPMDGGDADEPAHAYWGGPSVVSGGKDRGGQARP
ncbi:MAG TPA: hypothetical protein VHS36_04420 [Candidatus Limnocylindrales bacterium]|nr:hypothetical protein [Candidatus Limnocylindrales bacterium]